MLSLPELFVALAIGVLGIILYFLMQQPAYDPPPPPARPPSPPPRELPTAVLTTRTPYNEDEIAEIITKIYEVLVELCYISAEEIAWPTSAGVHVINLQLCEKLGISSTAISLMKKIPYPKDVDYACRMELFPYSNPYCYLDAGETRSGRDPENVMEEYCRVNYLLPQDIALTHNPRDGEAVVIDTKESKLSSRFMLIWERIIGLMTSSLDVIRVIGASDWYTPAVPPRGKLERPDEPRHYRNITPLHAPSYLRWHLESIEKLDIIPSRDGIGEGFHGRFNGEEYTVHCLLYPGLFVTANCSRSANQNEENSGGGVPLARQFQASRLPTRYGWLVDEN